MNLRLSRQVATTAFFTFLLVLSQSASPSSTTGQEVDAKVKDSAKNTGPASDSPKLEPESNAADAQPEKATKTEEDQPEKGGSSDKSPVKQKISDAKTVTPSKTSDAKGNKTEQTKPTPKPKKTKVSKPEPPKPDPLWTAKGVWTAPPLKGPAAVDFRLVGEYVGKVNQNQLGIQIRNLGTGSFEARAYEGGLPGQDGFQENKCTVMIGRRSGKTLVLSGGPWALFATPEACTIIDVEGKQLGKLPRANRTSSTLGAKPPKGAMVLFDGKDTKQFVGARMTPDGLLRQGANINFMLNDFDLHMEFQIPHMPGYLEQKRGNSGVYLQSRYECQVLDSFGTAKVFNGLGALYRFKPPRFNMALPPLSWQTYDIHFTAARFGANGNKLRNARVTSWVNGVKVQDDQQLSGPTGHGSDETPTLLPTKIQDHNDPVRYRNIWVIDRGLAPGVAFPPSSDNTNK